MATGAYALGRLLNISVGAVPTDAVAGAITGNRVRLNKSRACTFIVITSGGSTNQLQLDLQEANAATGGTVQDLDIVTKAYYQDASSFAGSETWTEWSQSAASEITNIGTASQSQLVVVEVRGEQLSDGFEYVSLNVPDLGSNGTKYVAILNVVTGLEVMRKPTNLASLQS